MLEKELNNLCVLVTRPNPKGKILCDLIRSSGGHPVFFPTIEICPIANSEQIIPKHVNELDTLIFISPQSVYQSSKFISAFPTHLKFAAIGAGTADALRDANLPIHCYPNKEWNTEGLLALPEFQKIKGQKIGIIKGEGGRELLAKELAGRGAFVFPIPVYRRSLPKVEIKEYLDLLSADVLNVIICTSYDSLKNLKILFDNVFSRLNTIPTMVISKRMVVQAKELGFKKILLAENADNHAILAALVKESSHDK